MREQKARNPCLYTHEKIPILFLARTESSWPANMPM